MVPPASHRVSRVPWYSGYCHLYFNFVYRTFTFFGLLSQYNSTISIHSFCSPQPQQARSLVWPSSISLAATLEIDFSFSSCCYLDVSVHNVPPAYLFIQYAVTELFSARFPHSDIHDSLNVCFLSWLFAAFYVLLRFLMPRHSPFALISLTFV